MRGVAAFLTFLVAAGCGGPSPSIASADPTPSAAACSPTQPNGDSPPGEDPSPGFFGDGRLYTSALSTGGEILAQSAFVGVDGSIGWKFPWWRAPGVGAAGDLRITGHETHTGAAIVASIPDGYGQRFQASGITFPSEGCYEITAQSGVARLTFVVRVLKVDAVPAS